MKTPIWKPELLPDLSGGWLAWQSPVGRMIVERCDRAYSAAWCPDDGDGDSDVKMLPPCRSIDEAQDAAVAWVRQEARHRLKVADRLRKAMDA